MRRRLSRIALGVALVCCLPCAAPRAADTPSSSAVIAVVDIQHILQESLAARSVQKQIETHRAAFQAETEKEENALRQAEQELGKARGHLAVNQYAEREQQLRQRTLTVERHFELRRKALDQAFADAKNMMSASVTETVQEIAHARGVTVVLTRQQVLWSEAGFDITREVLESLNKKLPKIPLKIDAGDKG